MRKPFKITRLRINRLRRLLLAKQAPAEPNVAANAKTETLALVPRHRNWSRGPVRPIDGGQRIEYMPVASANVEHFTRVNRSRTDCVRCLQCGFINRFLWVQFGRSMYVCVCVCWSVCVCACSFVCVSGCTACINIGQQLIFYGFKGGVVTMRHNSAGWGVHTHTQTNKKRKSTMWSGRKRYRPQNNNPSILAYFAGTYLRRSHDLCVCMCGI